MNPLENALTRAAQKMRADLEGSAGITHRGAKGRVRESKLVHGFLHEYMPRNVDVSHSGEIIDASGGCSPECDVLIYDKSAPILYSDQTFRVIPNECVYGVIEVKSKLDSKELEDSLHKIRKLKEMPKSAFVPQVREGQYNEKFRYVYGKRWTTLPTSGLIFAYDSIDLIRLADKYVEIAKDWPIEHMVDGIFVLNKGIILWTAMHGRNLAVAPEPGYGLQVLTLRQGRDEVLLWLTLVLHQTFSTAFMPSPLDILRYLDRDADDGLWNKYRVYFDGTSSSQRFDPDNPEVPLDDM